MKDPLGLLQEDITQQDPLGLIEKPRSELETLQSQEQREKTFGVIRKAPPKWIAPMETGLETLGLLGGGAIGSGLGPAGTVGGAALGYGAAKATSNVIQEMLGYRKPKPIAEGLKETGENVLEGALIEAGGAGAGKIISKVATPVKQLFTAPWGEALSTPESKELMRVYKEFNIPATPSDFIPSSKTLSIIEGVLGYRPVSGDVMLNKALQKVEALNNARIKLIDKNAPSDTVEVVGNRIRTEAEDILSKYTGAKGEKLSNLVNDFTQKMGVSERYKAGQKFSEVMSQAREMRHGITEDLYNKTKEVLPLKGEDIVPLSPDTISLAKQLMREELSKPPTMQDKKLLGILKFFGGGKTKLPEGIEAFMLEKDPLLMEKIGPTVKPKLTWTGMKETRSDLLERIRDIYKSQGQATKKSRIFGELSDAIDRDMSTFAEETGGDIWKTYSKAKESSKAMHELFDKDILKIMKSDPEDILGRVINKGEVSLLKQIKMAGGEQALIPLREGFFKRILDSSTTNQVLNPKRLSTNLDKITTETLSELTTPQQRIMLKNIIRTGKFFSEKMGKMKTVEFLETISNTDSSRVINGIIKPNNSYLVKIAKKLLPPERLQELQSVALEEKIFKMSGTGNYLPVSSSKAWKQYEAPMKELLSPKSFQAVSDFLKAGQNMTKVEALARNASQTGQVLLGSQVGGEVLRRPWRAPIALGIPYLIAKIYTNPKSIEFLTRALKVDPMSAEAISLFTKAVTLAGLNLKKQEKSEHESSLLPFGVEKTEIKASQLSNQQ
jgi:hypothetical protein